MPSMRLTARSTAAFVALRLAWVVGPGAVLASVALEGTADTCADGSECDIASVGYLLALLGFSAATVALVAVALACDAWRGRAWRFAGWHLAGVAVGALGCFAVFVYRQGPEPRSALDFLPYVAAFVIPYAAGLAAARRRDPTA